MAPQILVCKMPHKLSKLPDLDLFKMLCKKSNVLFCSNVVAVGAWDEPPEHPEGGGGPVRQNRPRKVGRLETLKRKN